MAKDPYHYFRIEARELAEGLARGLLELEKGASAETVRKLLRLAHTLKGAARVVKQVAVGALANGIEELLSAHRDSGAVERDAVSQALALLDEIRAGLALLDAPPQPEQPAGPTSSSEENLQSVRLGIQDLDGLIGGISESIAAVSAIQRDLQAPANDLGGGMRRLRGRAEQAIRELVDLRAAAIEMRLVPVDVLVSELERSVRDAAQSLNRRVRFVSSGTETRIDAAVLHSLRGALRHIVRNAVAHGIEDQSARAAAGKPPAGEIHLVVRRKGPRVSFLCRDDGRGMDVDAIRGVAVLRGLVSAGEAAALSQEGVLRLLLRGGVTTSRAVGDVAGRGVGLDVVRETTARLKGEVDIRTRPGQGTEVEVLVPVSLSSLPALEVVSGGVAAYAPLDSVRRTMRVKSTEISRNADGERVRFDDHYIPFADLSRVLSRAPRGAQATRTAVVLEVGGNAAAIGVDQLRGVHDIIVRPIPAHVRADGSVAGVALDDFGAPRIVLAPAEVVRWAYQAHGLPPEPPAAVLPPILVIDDSLTTRMLEQSILESAGYEVDLAVSAEDGLEMAQRRRYGLFIVDVEMPGMNGFDYIARTRQMPELRDVPAVLVTSRSDPADKRRGREVGARAYIVKSEFNQQEILRLIQGLIG